MIRKLISIWLAAIFLLAPLGTRLSSGLTVSEEEKLSRSILGYIYSHYEMIDDPVIVDYVNQVGNRIVSVIEEPLFNYRFHVVNVDTYNAFAIPAGYIFINSGLMAAMDNEEQLAGILAHEIAHVNARHISQKIERSKKIGWATMAGIAAGVLIGAAGGAEAGQALTQGSQAAGAAAELSYSRDNEIQADQLGLIYLNDAGYNGEGLLKILKKMRSKQWFGTEQIPTYMRTHPAIDERIAYLDSQLASTPKSTKTQHQVNPDDFIRAHTYLITQYGDENLVLKFLETEVKQHPEDPMAHYRYGLILARVGRRAEAIEHLRTALQKRAFDPYMLRDVGRVYYLDGQLEQSLKMLQTARKRMPDDPDCGVFLGQTYMAMGSYDEASAVLREVIEKNPGYTKVYYILGQSLGKQGNLADAHYYLGIYHYRKRDFKTAVVQYRQALKYTQDEERRATIEERLEKLEKALAKKLKRQG
ncbi:MAG: M48 family metalloprotease [Deltaproteobacteria bacterium]|jgi:predicted Zn-dependent protease|nr:M48 family metalloprotease [Deltaproteobacteria bacterium]